MSVMNVEKPHRASVTTFALDADDPFQDRRLSDLLPAEFIRQIGLDPDQFIFKTTMQQKMRRRATDPGLTQFDPAPPTSRRLSQANEFFQYPQMLSMNSLSGRPNLAGFNCFVVELSDCTVIAFAADFINAKTSDGVIVRDGAYLRLGRIISKATPDQITDTALQIVQMDVDGSVGDFIRSQTQIAAALMPSFMAQAHCTCEFISVETVSYQSRSLIRVKVTNADDPLLVHVVQKLLAVFGAPAEVYDDLSA